MKRWTGQLRGVVAMAAVLIIPVVGHASGWNEFVDFIGDRYTQDVAECATAYSYWEKSVHRNYEMDFRIDNNCSRKVHVALCRGSYENRKPYSISCGVVSIDPQKTYSIASGFDPDYANETFNALYSLGVPVYGPDAAIKNCATLARYAREGAPAATVDAGVCR